MGSDVTVCQITRTAQRKPCLPVIIFDAGSFDAEDAIVVRVTGALCPV